MQCRLMRLMRQKHGISTRELARCTGLSQQRVSELERSVGETTQETHVIIARGFYNVMLTRQRACNELVDDLHRYYGQLMAVVEEGTTL